VPAVSDSSRRDSLRIPLSHLLRLVRRSFPEWQGFDDPRFNEEEIAYKQETVRFVHDSLGEDNLRHLLGANRLDDFLSSVEEACKHNNLLYRSAPKSGDYAVLFSEGLDKRSFCEALFNLLHGDEESPVRLERYLAYIRQHGLPNRWAFPTYLLFFRNPEGDYFVKPTVTRWFLELVGAKDVYSPDPSGKTYEEIRYLIERLRTELIPFGVRHMIDVQSFLFVAHAAQKNRVSEEPRVWKIAPGESGWQWRECLEGGFIGVGWEELGDMSQMNRDEFEVRRNELVSQRKDFTVDGTEQAWKFAHILPGDKIVANEGTRKILGIGVVSGPYYFVPGVTYGHRLPVTWEDTTPRSVDKPGWRRTLIELDRAEFEKLVAEFSSPVQVAFSSEAFEILVGLHENPTKAYYQEHKDRFQALVETPFQQLFQAVVSRLPDPILQAMETERQVFSRIPKNDYGRGGAWPFYWGALYPKGGNRTRDPQLALSLNHDHLEAGFYIGDYGSEKRALFLRNCSLLKDSLPRLLASELSDPEFIFGTKDHWTDAKTGAFTKRPEISFQEWLRNPAEAGIDVSVIYLRSELGRTDRERLADNVADVFKKLFPLVLLTVSDNPSSSIRKYLDEEDQEPSLQGVYTLTECAADTGFAEEDLERWVRSIRRKRQAVLYGPPGTGKTHIARKLAEHLVGGGRGFSDLVQFHPSYSYEEFIQGIRPEPLPGGGGLDYPLKKGRFLEFCDRAREAGESPCVLIIDEINRAHLSRVFGELMYLLEYRGHEIPLAAGRPFSIPENVYILGTMNTADRSIALVDHALRRRFAFIGLRPNMDILRRVHGDSEWVEPLIQILSEVNQEIGNPHYEVGVTFFLGNGTRGEIEDIWQMEIYPYLEEYFFDQPTRAEKFAWSNIRKRLDL
jgi:5-methylcytosine-specific restriction protein B